jgi:hypothetical protein
MYPLHAREQGVHLLCEPGASNQDGSEWQFVTNVELYSRKEGLLILDILTDQRVGGVEFINNIMDARMLGPVRPNVQRRA